MRILAVADSHLTMRNPRSRKDIYYESILDQWCYLGEAAIKHNAVAILHAGDVFDTPKVSNRLAGWLTQIIKDFPCKIYAVPGNHDIFGHNISTLDQTMFGLLAKAGVFVSLTRGDCEYISSEGIKIKLHGHEYHSEIDKRDWHMDYDIDADPRVDYNFLIVHGMLSDVAMPEFIHHTQISEIQNTSADLVLAGHNHNGFKNTVVSKNNKFFVNPGDMARKDASPSSMRIPEYVVIDITRENGIQIWTESFSCAKPWDEIFDIEAIEAKKSHTEFLDKFRESVSINEKFVDLDIFSMLQTAVDDLQLNIEIKEMALKELQNAQDNDEDNKKVNLDYLSLDSVSIEKVDLVNFQSHKNTTIEFSANGLNAVLGMSDQGKTAIIRALRWVLYNDPQGSEFITTGEKQCEVSVHFNNGTIVKRRRTEKSSGEYELIQNNGESQIFSSFGVNVPPDISIAHQMPLISFQKGNEKSLNISYQLDGPFLLSESPIVRASAIGKLVGAQAIDASIKEISRKIGNSQREIGIKNDQKEKAIKQLAQFSGLQDLKIHIEKVEKLVSEHDLFQNIIEQYKILSSKLQKVISSKSVVIKQSDDYIYVDEAVQKDRELDDIASQYRILLALERTYGNTLQEITKQELIMHAIPDLNEVDSFVQKIDFLFNTSVAIDGFNKKLKSYAQELDGLEKTMSTIPDMVMAEKLTEQAKITVDIVNSLSTLSKKKDNIDKQVNTIATEYNHTVAIMNENILEYGALLKEMNQCPLCLSDITLDKIDHILHEMKGS